MEQEKPVDNITAFWDGNAATKPERENHISNHAYMEI